MLRGTKGGRWNAIDIITVSKKAEGGRNSPLRPTSLRAVPHTRQPEGVIRYPLKPVLQTGRMKEKLLKKLIASRGIGERTTGSCGAKPLAKKTHQTRRRHRDWLEEGRTGRKSSGYRRKIRGGGGGKTKVGP